MANLPLYRRSSVLNAWNERNDLNRRDSKGCVVEWPNDQCAIVGFVTGAILYLPFEAESVRPLLPNT